MRATHPWVPCAPSSPCGAAQPVLGSLLPSKDRLTARCSAPTSPRPNSNPPRPARVPPAPPQDAGGRQCPGRRGIVGSPRVPQCLGRAELSDTRGQEGHGAGRRDAGGVTPQKPGGEDGGHSGFWSCRGAWGPAQRAGEWHRVTGPRSGQRGSEPRRLPASQPPSRPRIYGRGAE